MAKKMDERLEEEYPALVELVKDYLIPGIKSMLRDEIGRISGFELEGKRQDKKIEEIRAEHEDIQRRLGNLEGKQSKELLALLLKDK